MDFAPNADGTLLRLEPWWVEFGVLAAFSTRCGGASGGAYATNNLGLHVGDQGADVLRNRVQTAQRLGVSLQDWVVPAQVHGTGLAWVDERKKGLGAFGLEDALSDCDGLLTRAASVVLAAFFADCAPVYFLDPEERVLALVHAGWRGALQGIIANTLAAFRERGIEAGRLQVALGPAICAGCYPVGVELATALQSLAPWGGPHLRDGHFDLRGFLVADLRRQGVLDAHLTPGAWCTSCNPRLFFSHRRDRGNSGRMGAFLCQSAGNSMHTANMRPKG